MFDPNIALLPEQIQEIGTHVRRSDWPWFVRRGIDVAMRGEYLLLNTSAELNRWNVLANGLVLSREGVVMSAPPFKISRMGQARCDIRNCRLVEKLPGDMIGLFYPFAGTSFFVCHTKNQITTDSDDLNELLLRAKSIIANLSRAHIDVKFSLTFQFNGNDLHLIAARHLSSMGEYTEDELDILANRLEVHRPVHHPCRGWLDMKNVMTESDSLFIARDNETGDRVLAYIDVDRPKLLAEGRYKYIIPHWQRGDAKIISKQYPLARPKCAIIDDAVLLHKKAIKQYAALWSRTKVKRQDMVYLLRESHLPQWQHAIVLKLLGMDENSWDGIITEFFRKMPAKAMMTALNLKD